MYDRRDAAPLRWGPFALDLRARELLRDGCRIRLQDKPFELLLALVERPGEIVSREELRLRLWPADTFVAFDDGLNTAVSKLREALGDSAERPQFVETVPRRGYRFIAPVAAPPAVTPAGPERSDGGVARRWRRDAVLAIGLLVVASAAGWLAWRSGPPAADLVRLEIRAPEGAAFADSSAIGILSPDGRQIASLAIQPPDRPVRIWVQALDGSGRRILPGTDHAEDFAWSPDGRSIAFRRPPGDLLRHDIAQGVNVRIAGGLGLSVGLSWHADAGILIARGPGHGLARVAMDGATAVVTELDVARQETMHTWPQLLGDGRSYIYLALSRIPKNSGIYLGRFGDPSRHLIVASAYKAVVAPPDILLWLQDQRLVAQRFDAGRAVLIGNAVTVAEGLIGSTANGAAAISVSESGTLAHARPRRSMSRETIWLTRAGQLIRQLNPSGHDASFSLSPDGRWVLFERLSEAPLLLSPELWLLDVERSVTRRVTDHPGNDEGGAWSPDSRRFVYARHRDLHQPSDLYVKDVSHPEIEQPLLAGGSSSRHPFDWSPDGRFILFSMSSPGVPEDIWVLPLDSRHPPYPWLATRFRERGATFSPDGKWVAYESDESGVNEIYVRAFADPRARWQVSINGGMSPQWRRDGRELFYTSDDHRMTAVAIRNEKDFDPGEPQPLFELRRLAPNPTRRTPYAVSADGQRFLVGAVTDEGGDSALNIVLNWSRLLDR
jgi:eukaryotic-like serine/threonine-protein kinase